MVFQVTISLLLMLSIFISSSADKLPDDSRLVAGRCLQTIIKPIFQEETSKHKTVHEFLEKFCSDLPIKEIQDQLQEHNINASAVLRECLAQQKRNDVFTKYIDLGISVADDSSDSEYSSSHSSGHDSENDTEPEEQPSTHQDPPASENSIQHEEQPLVHQDTPTSPTIPSSPQPHYSPLNSPPANSLKRQRDYEVDDGGDDEEPESSEKIVDDFTIFSEGLCNSTEFVIFDQLEDPNDKSIALSCSENCLQSFFLELENILKKEIQNVKVEGKSLEIDHLPAANTFRQTCENSDAKSMQDVSNIGEKWLLDYSTLYNKSNSSSFPSNEGLGDTLKDILYRYVCCIKWGCAMNNLRDLVLNDWINKNTNNPLIGLMKMLRYEIERSTSFRSSSPGDTPTEPLEGDHHMDIEQNLEIATTSDTVRLRRRDKKPRLDTSPEEQPKEK